MPRRYYSKSQLLCKFLINFLNLKKKHSFIKCSTYTIHLMNMTQSKLIFLIVKLQDLTEK